MTARIKLLIFFITTAIFLFSGKLVFAQNLLQNPGFEEGISNWEFTPSTATFSATTSLKHSGEYSALLTKENSASWTYFFQRVNVEENKHYKLSGWVVLNDEAINNVKLRFYWLDATEKKISSEPIETELKEINSSFKFLETESSLSSLDAYFAEIQGYVYLKTKNPSRSALFDDLMFEKVDPPTSTPSLPSSPSPSPSSTPSPAPVKATYKINEVKDSDGNTLSSVKIYVEGAYIHHYAPETLEFCDECYCDDDKQVKCGFGDHTIKLEKSGYQDWSDTKTMSVGDSYEVDPVMDKPTDTPTSTPAPTPTPTLTPPSPSSPTAFNRDLRDVLAEELATESSLGTIAGEVTQSSELTLATATPSSKFRKVLGGIFLSLGGLAILGSSAFPFLKRKLLEKEGQKESH